MDPLSAALPPISASRRDKISGDFSKRSFKSGIGKLVSLPQRLPNIGSTNPTSKAVIIDEEGNDVTPRPIYGSYNTISKLEKPSLINLSSLLTLKQDTSNNNEPADSTLMYAFANSLKGSRKSSIKQRSYQASAPSDSNASDVSSTVDETEFQPSTTEKQLESIQQSFKNQEETFSFVLSETNTMCFLDIPSECPGTDYNLREQVMANNSKYLKNCSQTNNADEYSQSLRIASKCRESQTPNKKKAQKETQTNYQSIENDNKRQTISRTSIISQVSQSVNKSTQLVSMSTVTSSKSLLSFDKVASPQQQNLVINEENMLNNLKEIEECLLDKINMKKVMQYYNLNVDAPVNDDESAAKNQSSVAINSLNLLWNFRSELTKGKCINSLAWNNVEIDILAAGYSPNYDDKGLIIIWSMKKPDNPYRIFQCDSDPVCLDFAKKKHTILAAGFSDGSISLYNIASKSTEPICTLQHYDLVSSIKWISDDLCEYLISAGHDGRILKWNMEKSMECTELINFDANGESGVLTNCVAILCFDAREGDGRLLIGNEDGQIKVASNSHGNDSKTRVEHCIQAFDGGVQRIRWSPDAQTFLCSTNDSQLKQFDCEGNQLASIQSSTAQSPITDISWLNHSIFGLVTANGTIELWDISKSLLSPLIQHSILDHCLQKIVFSPNSSCILTADSVGTISVYKIKLY